MRTTGLLDGAGRLRARLATRAILAAPGAGDPLSARLVAEAGFEAVYMTGLGATASRLGVPDLGLMTSTEMAEQVRALVQVSDLPVIADADTGYGGPLNLRRAFQDYAMAGAAALHLEDQESPKRCGQLSGVRLIDRADAARRLLALVAIRDEMRCDMVLIGRTDALQPLGAQVALDRARAYRDAGVDLVFVDGIKTRAEIETVARGLDGPKVVSIVDGTDAASITLAELEQMGFSIALFAVTALFGAIKGSRAALSALKRDGHASVTCVDAYADYAKAVDLANHQNFARKYES